MGIGGACLRVKSVHGAGPEALVLAKAMELGSREPLLCLERMAASSS